MSVFRYSTSFLLTGTSQNSFKHQRLQAQKFDSRWAVGTPRECDFPAVFTQLSMHRAATSEALQCCSVDFKVIFAGTLKTVRRKESCFKWADLAVEIETETRWLSSGGDYSEMNMQKSCLKTSYPIYKRRVLAIYWWSPMREILLLPWFLPKKTEIKNHKYCKLE